MIFSQFRFSSPIVGAVLAGLMLWSQPMAAQAGCGCDKPPPAPAAVRPNATYASTQVSLFSSSLQVGQSYTVTFTSGTTGQAATVQAQAVSRQDLADGQYKPQLNVALPAGLPLGPTSISVSQTRQGGAVLAVADDAFTVVPAPISVPAQVGEFHFQNFQMAVSRAGVVYMSLDLSNVTLPIVFQAQAKGYPLRFSSDDVVFYNTQGFLMQLLDQNMPGLGSSAAASNSSDSDTLHYSRHEFHTFYLQHEEKQNHQLDADDSNWHQDGTRHIDHDHLVLAIAGTVNNGSLPTPGATPAFEMVVNTFSLFHQGLFGNDSVDMTNDAATDSYNSKTGLLGARGDVLSNGLIKLSNYALVDGNVKGLRFDITDHAQVTGTKTTTTQATNFMPLSVPKELPDLGNIVLNNGATQTLVGPASYKVGKIDLSNNSRLIIDNTAGPVTLYVTKYVVVNNTAQISANDTNPEKIALYMINGGDVIFSVEGAFYGVVYAPQSVVDLSNGGEFFGAFVGKQVKLSNGAQIHYDTALRGK